MNEKRLAIIKEVGFGLRDVGQPCLWFSTYINDAVGALHILYNKDIEKVLKDAHIYDVKELEGKSCWVEVDGMVIKFLEMSKI